MPIRPPPFTAARVRTAPPGRYGDGKGLYLYVRPGIAGPSRTWVFRYRLPGAKLRDMGLGSVDILPLAEARMRALDLLRKVRAGTDPLAERAAERAKTAAVKTFADVAGAYIKAH